MRRAMVAKDNSQAIHQIDEHVGEQLKNRRKKLGLSQAVLGEKVNLSLQQIQKYEQGVNRVAASKLYEFSHILRVPISYFFDGLSADVLDGRDTEGADMICFRRKKPLSILLVEDNPADEVLARKALESCDEDVNIHSVHDGVEAIQWLRHDAQKNGMSSIDIIILDLNIPKMSGLDFLKEVKKDRTIQNIPVIVITNSINPSDMEEAYRAQASGFIGKSFDVDEFNRHMNTLVKYWSSTVVLPSMQII